MAKTRFQGLTGKRVVVLFAVVLAAALFFGTGKQVMALFKKVVLFSELSGQVMLNGKPVAGVKVVQETIWGRKNDVKPSSTATDKDGKFKFLEIARDGGFYQWLPSEVSIVQKILFEHQGKTYKGWLSTKRNYDENGEQDGRPLRLVCELSDKETRHDTYYGICKLQKNCKTVKMGDRGWPEILHQKRLPE